MGFINSLCPVSHVEKSDEIYLYNSNFLKQMSDLFDQACPASVRVGILISEES